MAVSDCEMAVLRFYVSLNCLKMKLTFIYGDKKGVLTRDPLEKHILNMYDRLTSFAIIFVLVVITIYQIVFCARI